MQMKRLAVTGPESTGKTRLSLELSRRLNLPWVAEYARDYISQLGREYSFDDVTKIARAQLASITAMIDRQGAVVSDTELLVTAIWQEVRFGKLDPWIAENIARQPFDLYLLCAPDIPWEFDPLREHPEMREELFIIYREKLVALKLPFVVVEGLGEDRYQRALASIVSEEEQNPGTG